MPAPDAIESSSLQPLTIRMYLCFLQTVTDNILSGTMTKLYIVVAQSDFVHWNTTAFAEVLGCLIRLQPTLRRILRSRNGILAVRYVRDAFQCLSGWFISHRSFQCHGRNPDKTLKLFRIDGVLLGSIHFSHAHRRDVWFPCESIEVALNRVRLALGRRLSAKVCYNERDHVSFHDEL